MSTKSHNYRYQEHGFSLIELLVAVFIMSVGFLALSQMEFLSLRQQQMSEAGSNATNIIQFAADRDMGEIKRIALLNARTFVVEAAGRDADYTYCNGSSDASVCSNCPCNPLTSVADNPTSAGTKDVECAAVSLNSSDIESIDYTTDQTQCLSDYNGLGTEGLFIIRNAIVTSDTSDTVTISSIYNVHLTYSVKNLEQMFDSNLSLNLRDNLAVQGFTITAQTDDYSDTVPVSSGSWGTVIVPYVP